jgi:hypothetical protein
VRKKSAAYACEWFSGEVDEIVEYLAAIEDLTDEQINWCYDYAVIRLYRAFENLMLSCLICSMNNDTEQVSSVTGIPFPKHLTDEVCEYIIVGEGYFDFRGRDGLIKTVKRYVPDDHYLLKAIKEAKYRDALEQLSALRNFAAHESQPSKKAALKAIGKERMSSAGSWLKRQDRFERIAERLVELADEIADSAPY